MTEREKKYTTNELKPIETTSVKKSGLLLTISNLNEVNYIWEATWIEVYETAKKYYFLAGGWNEEKSGAPRFKYKAYSAYKKDIQWSYQEAAKYIMKNPNWQDW